MSLCTFVLHTDYNQNAVLIVRPVIAFTVDAPKYEQKYKTK